MHRETERKVKKWIRQQYQSHGTDVAMFTDFTGTDYEREVADLGRAIFKYIPQEEKRQYTQTVKIDWR